ncbi:NAD(P)-dependent dehydrogenase (short-subunit alcohol dehydrogenase family) [Agrococcus sp. UYP10]|uniref:SDR family NAD(P)-dependent oxidoreductase n=1 Tax=Agrococcus sp. UYP10 TaxID=1756355 RepID=UPI0033965758
MTRDFALSGASTLGAWLQDPAGAPLVEEIATRSGMDARALAMLRRVSLQRLVELSGRPDAQEIVAQLVARVRDARGPSGAEVADPAWSERISVSRFDGETVVVTGAASGIGRAVASRIAREGGTVVAVDLAEDRLLELAEGLPNVRAVRADITTERDVQRIVDAADGAVHGLANVAGVLDDFSPLHEMEDAVMQRVFEVNVFGLMRLSRACLPLMLAAGRGSIVNVASEAALRGSSAGAAYTASKHAVIGVTRSAAFMYEPAGIRVNAVAPGGTLTGMRPTRANEFGQTRVQSHASSLPIAVPEAVAAPITYLLSHDAINVNGAVLPADGGESVF